MIVATRAPNISAVLMSPGGGKSSGAPRSDWAIAPVKLLNRLTSFGPVPATISACPTQIMPCCIAFVTRHCSVFSLSPLRPPEFVNPAAILSFHPCLNHTFDALSMNVLNSALGPLMYVGVPKMIASASANAAKSSPTSAALRSATALPGTPSAPRPTASAIAFVCPYPLW